MSVWGRTRPASVTEPASSSTASSGTQGGSTAAANSATTGSNAQQPTISQTVSALSKLRQMQRPQSAASSSPLASPQITETVHPLRATWCLWWLHRSPGSRIKDYETAMKRIGAFSSVEDFFAIYAHLRRIDELPIISDYHLFKAGVKPTYEDPANAGGGKWQLRLKKGLSARLWEDLVFAMIGDQFFEFGDEEICGAVMSVRAGEDVLSVWNKSATNGALNLKIRQAIKRVLGLGEDVQMEYVSHETRTAQSQQQAAQATQGQQGGHQQTGHHHHHNHHHSHGHQPRQPSADQPSFFQQQAATFGQQQHFGADLGQSQQGTGNHHSASGRDHHGGPHRSEGSGSNSSYRYRHNGDRDHQRHHNGGREGGGHDRDRSYTNGRGGGGGGGSEGRYDRSREYRDSGDREQTYSRRREAQH